MGYNQSKNKQDEFEANISARHTEFESRIANYGILIITLVVLIAIVVLYTVWRICNRRLKGWIRHQAAAQPSAVARGFATQSQPVHAAAAGYA